MKHKTVLVTGGTGFVGSNLVTRLVHEGYRPVLLVRKEANFSRIKDVIGKVKIIETDITDYKKLYKDIHDIKPHIVFHLAVYGAYQRRQTGLTDAISTNIIGTANLLEVCSQTGFEHFVNTGSSSEYGLMTRPAKETDALNPTNFYGVTKATVTMLTKVYEKQHKLPISTLRLFSPYGYYEDVSRFIPTLILGSILNKSIKLSSPKFVRDFIFIDDTIDAYMRFVQKKYIKGATYNIASGCETRLGDVVKIIEAISGRKLKIDWQSRSVDQIEPKIWEGDIKKAKNVLNWSPQTSLHAGLKKVFVWFNQNKEFYL